MLRFTLSLYFELIFYFELFPGYYQPAGPLITAGPLHGGFKDTGGPSPYQYPQQVCKL